VALDQGIPLKLREALAVFVDLTDPHAQDRLAAGISEAVDELGVV
jgi:hypothetical protein